MYLEKHDITFLLFMVFIEYVFLMGISRIFIDLIYLVEK